MGFVHMPVLSGCDWKSHGGTYDISMADNMGRVPDVKISQSALHNVETDNVYLVVMNILHF